jgi:HSP20 family protein
MATIVRWNPVREMAGMQSAMDRLFDETWRNFRNGAPNLDLPLDIHETETSYLVIAELPGVPSDAVNVSLHDGVLTISGEFQQETTPENSRALMLERTYGKFTRSIRLPQAVIADQIEATLENGVLTLNLPKTPEAQPRQIPVRVNSVSGTSKASQN